MRTTGKRHHEELETKFDFDADIAIDPNYLDAEFLNHASVFMKYAKESAWANKQVKICEEKIKLIRSRLIKEVTEDPEECLGKGIKATAPTIEAYYRDHEDHIRAKRELIEATYYADLLQNAVFAFQARKTALENLVRLYGQEYFSSPQEPRDLQDAVTKLEELKKKSTMNKIKERMGRN